MPLFLRKNRPVDTWPTSKSSDDHHRGQEGRGHYQAAVFSQVASTSSAYAGAFTTGGVWIGFDLVLFQSGVYAGYLTYAGLGSKPWPSTTAS